MKKRLITSALPYVNNIPHLGNLIQVLSADVFARFCRSRGYETLYVCGTDEYGTATETRAREEGVSPEELCSRYHAVHTEIYEWFRISFDKWGRTSTPQQTEIVQSIFLSLHAQGFIRERTIEQLYSEKSAMFLADRYVAGTCPKCGYTDARGDQCEECGSLLDPTDLIDPRSVMDGTRPVIRETTHLYIDLPAILPRLQAWMAEASERGRWARNAIRMTEAWIRDGLKERAITRDLKWGIPVPLEGFEDKVFYVWFDAPIGYISITATLTDQWEQWWKNPREVELFQFIGKDNIPFHTVIFPSSLLGSGQDWTMLHHMSSSEYLNYEGGQFSKSKGIGVFGTDARETGIPADVWRFYLFYNRPETSDYTFTWDDFQEKVNGELIGNLANLVNRTTTFLTRFFDGALPPEGAAPAGAHHRQAFWNEVRQREAEITEKMEWAGLRDGLRRIFALSSYGNRVFQAAEPWKTRTTDPEGTHLLLADLVYLVRDLAILIEPYLPATAERIRLLLGAAPGESWSWDMLGEPRGLSRIALPEILFEQLSDELIQELRDRFSGSQADRARRALEADAASGAKPGSPKGVRDGKPGAKSDKNRKDHTVSENTVSENTVNENRPDGNAANEKIEDRFAEKVELRAAKIIEVEQHPEADKLYIERLDDGTPEGRTIVSGLRGHYTPEELLGKTIVVVANLKPAKLRGVKSEGMLLAASSGEGDQEIVDVLFLEGVEPGSRVLLQGQERQASPEESLKRLKADDFFALPIRASGGTVFVGETPLVDAGGNPLKTLRVSDGAVG
ncbi:methionine--tRNA ligase [Alkalispirochaeta sphaeroplastigenens]|uniref:Methionine--tRNA ligase n=1 Tax=Alkalispirochaeta sphaeroplastigenens TaxID=1187066 RepID=A0A2S4K0Z6_9SPIO|nr:methionine--tRNA ligase [Alkalispirochaeta sphaeroplastigenens]POR05429.1 methionine--tRNA ligase [Alkalispirochaeta sphaeroplastigenens]